MEEVDVNCPRVDADDDRPFDMDVFNGDGPAIRGVTREVVEHEAENGGWISACGAVAECLQDDRAADGRPLGEGTASHQHGIGADAERGLDRGNLVRYDDGGGAEAAWEKEKQS